MTVLALRTIALLALAAPLLLRLSGRRAHSGTQARRSRGDRLPVAANLAAFVVFLSALFSTGGSQGSAALWLASSGSLLSVAGAVLVFRSRTEIGSAWSLVPRADRGTGLVTTGPYRLVRHPIYLGLTLTAAGEALAFASWPALAIAACGVIPTFAWRARVEEAVLERAFGETYAIYRERTRMIIPYLF